MVKNKRFVGLIIAYILCVLLFQPAAGNAEETTSSSGSAGGFVYEVIKPDNQMGESLGYYKLKMTPGQVQTLQIRLTNPGDEGVTVLVDLKRAGTNSNGVIDYNDNLEKDDSMKFDIEEIATVPEEVVLGPGEEKMLEIQINMPETNFEGYLSGGIDLTRAGQVEESDATVVNVVSYRVGLVLTEQDQEEIDAIPENVEFNKVYPDTYNYRNAFMVSYSNVQPTYLEGMTLDVQITREGSEAVLFDSKKSDMRMASNSKITYPVYLEGEQMEPGDYRAKIVVTSAKGGRWEWDEAFTVTDEDADKFNEADLTLVQESGLDWKLIAMIAAGVLGVILLIFLIVHFTRKKRKGNKKIAKKNTKKRPALSNGKKRKKV